MSGEKTVYQQVTMYGTCPRGHGDKNGEIAAETSYDARQYPNCPICGARLKDTHEVIK